MNISITRGNHYADRLRKYKIFIDDACIGEISNNETKKFALSPGKHSLYFQIDWCKSNTLTIASDKSTKFFRIDPNVKPWTLLFVIIFMKDKYLIAREINLLLTKKSFEEY